jgi:FkbM family methyltransferase
MLLDLGELNAKFGLRISGIVHIGAHLAEEAPLYRSLGVPVVWVEANPRVINQIHKVLQDLQQPCPLQEVMNWLVLEEERYNVPFHITNYDGMSSSVYNWGTHTQFSPDTVVEETLSLKSVTLDRVFDYVTAFRPGETFNMLNIDVEGAGLDVLRGGPRMLETTDYIYIEVQTENVYDGAPFLFEYDAFLEKHFQRVELGMVEGQGWGDAFYMRRPW